MMPIVKAPNEILATAAKPIKKIDKEIVKLIEDMKKTLAATHDPEGVGLAAPQAGEPLALFIAKPTPKSACLVFINPKIIKISEKLVELTRPKNTKNKPKKLEGCLSLPAIWGPVKRSESLAISYLDEHGKKHAKTFTGFLATIIQHEMDHLDGILFPKRVLEQKGKLYKSRKNKEGKDIFEEINI